MGQIQTDPAAQAKPLGNVDWNGKKITNLANPTPGSQEAATANYTDAAIAAAVSSAASAGWLPVAFPIGFVSNMAFTTASALGANGGSYAVPMLVNGNMQLDSVTFRSTDTTLARTWGWTLYKQVLATDSLLTQVAASAADETWTASAASTRSLAANGAPVVLAPGIYWLVIQNRHATNTLGMAYTAQGTAFARNVQQSKTTTVPNADGLDFATGWAKGSGIVACALNGRVFGATAGF